MFNKKADIANSLGEKGGVPTYIGSGMKIEGKLRCVGAIRIDGQLKGTIECLDEVTIGPTAQIYATIHAARVLVNGKIEGNLFVTDKLEALSGGHIIGNVSTPAGRLMVHEGAIVEGQCLKFETKLPDKTSKTVTPENTSQEKADKSKDSKVLSPQPPNNQTLSQTPV